MNIRSKNSLQIIPGIGPSMAKDLESLGMQVPEDLKTVSPQDLFDRLCAKTGGYQDPCVLYTFRCAVYFVKTPAGKRDPELLKWWNWKDRT